MHAFSVDFVSSLWLVLRAAGTDAGCVYVCCRRGEERTQHFGYGTVAVPATLLCSHGLLQMQRLLLPLCVGMWLRDLLEMLIKLH